jgi:6-pyruvoyl-tetrahydropterin synthase
MKPSFKSPTQISLKVLGELKASHSLAGFEVPHFHRFKVALEFQASLPLKQDRLIDLVQLQNDLQKILAPLEGRHLNSALPDLSPTSENLAIWIWDQFLRAHPQAPLKAVSITLCDLEGRASGEARVES